MINFWMLIKIWKSLEILNQPFCISCLSVRVFNDSFVFCKDLADVLCIEILSAISRDMQIKYVFVFTTQCIMLSNEKARYSSYYFFSWHIHLLCYIDLSFYLLS